ncbi:hypothetical protein ACFMQL_09745 [Nonomuraea fastidiosa]|uniref:hypothetical protein n=1 Tax=Nonomuraea fastidiosa TaxID=46173 RepID=UPI0036717856
MTSPAWPPMSATPVNQARRIAAIAPLATGSDPWTVTGAAAAPLPLTRRRARLASCRVASGAG